MIDSFNRDPIQCKCKATMQYTYTYNPFKDKRNDRTYRKECIDEMIQMYKRRLWNNIKEGVDENGKKMDTGAEERD